MACGRKGQFKGVLVGLSDAFERWPPDEAAPRDTRKRYILYGRCYLTVTWVKLEKNCSWFSLKTQSPKFELNSRIKSLEGFFLFACRKRPGQDPIKKNSALTNAGFSFAKIFKEILGHNPT